MSTKTSLRASRPVGDILREWRRRRHLSQLELACDAQISQRHLSFVESGKSAPSKEMLLHLAEQLDVPLRERNALLLAAGYAPAFKERPLADPALQAARKVVDQVLTGHEPYPAIAVDRHWILQASNRALPLILTGLSPAVLEPPINVLRLSLHPDGLAPKIANLPQWRTHILARLRRQVELSADPVLAALLAELTALPSVGGDYAPDPVKEAGYLEVAIPLQLIFGTDVLSFISTTTVFGTPTDITLSELILESFFPANLETAEAMRRLLG